MDSTSTMPSLSCPMQSLLWRYFTPFFGPFLLIAIAGVRTFSTQTEGSVGDKCIGAFPPAYERPFCFFELFF